MNDSRAKFQIDITEEQRLRALKCFPEYGMRKAVMSRILDEVMDMIDEYGFTVVGVILDSGTPLRSIVPSLAKAEKVVKKGMANGNS